MRTENYGAPTSAADNALPIVAVCLPSGEYIKARTAFSLLCNGIICGEKYRIMPMNMMGQDPAQSRNQMAQACMEHGAEWFLFVDCDMVMPGDALKRLMAHDLDIVGADYRSRIAPYAPIGRPAAATAQPDTGLAEREWLGLGLILVRRRVLETLEAPWFVRVYRKDGFATEDVYFCTRARSAGFKIWCDMDLTREVSHIGEITVPWQMSGGN